MTQEIYEPISLELLQEVLDNFPDSHCKLICFTIKSNINKYEYTFSRVNNTWKCTLEFKYAHRAPISFDTNTLKTVISRAELLSGCPDNKKLIRFMKNPLKETFNQLKLDPLSIEMFEEIKEDVEDYKYPLATKTICNFIIDRIRNKAYRKDFE